MYESELKQLDFIYYYVFCSLDGFEQKSRVKRPRAPPPPEEPENYVDDYDDLGERNNPLNSKYVPAGFLSPSVQEYLELGKSIPGRRKQLTVIC